MHMFYNAIIFKVCFLTLPNNHNSSRHTHKTLQKSIIFYKMQNDRKFLNNLINIAERKIKSSFDIEATFVVTFPININDS